MEKSSETKLSLTIKSWNKDTEDLFDFDTDNITTETFTIDSIAQSEYLFKLPSEIVKATSPLTFLSSNPSAKALLEIAFNASSQYLLIPSFNSETLKSISEDKIDYTWIKLPNDYIQIKIGDIIKIGRVRIKLSSFSNNDNNNNITTSSCLSGKAASISMKTQRDMCRICYRCDSDIDDPLISPCQCTGSIKYIHYKCLQSAIASKLNVFQNEFCKLVTWKNYQCEICKCEYPTCLQYKNRKYPLIDYQTVPFSQFAVFDYFLYDDEEMKPFRNGMLFINTSIPNEEITLGRTQTNKIKLRNISVSRIHCSLMYQNGNIYIKDNGSKFGTMMYMKENFVFSTNRIDNMKNASIYKRNNCTISIGRFSFEFMVEKKKKFVFGDWFGLNCCRNPDLDDSYCIIQEEEEEEHSDIKVATRKSPYEDNVKYIDNIITAIDAN